MILKRPSRKYIAGVMIVTGSICGFIALVSLLVAWHFVRTAATATGRVIQMVERDGERGHLYAPVFVFRDSRGAEHTIQSDTASDPAEHRVGDTISVMYSSEDPEHAKIHGFFPLWGLPLATGLLAGVHLLPGLVVWYWPRIVRRFRNESPVTNMR